MCSPNLNKLVRGECARYKLLWEDHFNGTALAEQWTAYDNCTHGNEAELYMADAAVVEDGCDPVALHTVNC